jgi:hypothetical protein
MAIEKVGPSVIVQTGGMTEAGLEKSVKPYLPFIDVGLWRERLFRLEGRVCRVEINNGARGTGFLVGPDTVLTNYHVMREVIENPTLAPTVKLRFDYRVLSDGAKSNGTVISLAKTGWLIDWTPCTPAEAKSDPDAVPPPTVDQLDFALVKVERAIGSEPLTAASGSAVRGWIPVPDVAPLITSDPAMPILILQHPNTEPLKLAVDTAGVLELLANGTRIRYATNTEPGSSGSPCFNIDWKLIALHHYGDPLHDKAQYNQGIPIHLIRERLKRKGAEGCLGNAMEIVGAAAAELVRPAPPPAEPHLELTLVVPEGGTYAIPKVAGPPWIERLQEATDRMGLQSVGWVGSTLKRFDELPDTDSAPLKAYALDLHNWYERVFTVNGLKASDDTKAARTVPVGLCLSNNGTIAASKVEFELRITPAERVSTSTLGPRWKAYPDMKPAPIPSPDLGFAV